MGALRSSRDTAIATPAIGGQPAVSAGLFVAPVVLTLLTTRAGYDAAAAASLLSLEMTISALATLALSGFIRSGAARRLAVLGGGLVVVGNAMSLISSAPGMLAPARALAGLGGGVLAAAIAVISVRARNPERLFSLQTVCSILAGSICLALIPVVAPVLGYRAPYAVLLGVGILALALVSRLPAPPSPAAVRVRSRRVAGFAPVGLAALGGVVLTQLGQGAFWTFVGQFGLSAGLSETEIGGFLSVATLMLLAGVAGAAVAGARFGRIGPLVALVAVNALSILVITLSRDPATYIGANVVQAMTNLSSVVFELGLAAALDRSGRLAAAAAGLITLGNGLGPSLGGAIARAAGAGAIGPAVLVLNLGALVAFAGVGLSLGRPGRVRADP